MLKILELLTFEQLPNGKHEREFEIANRFVASQKSIFGREFILDEEYQIRRGQNEDPDCKAREGDIKWDIELTEVVHGKHAADNNRQTQYAQSIKSILENKSIKFEGLYIYIDDNYQDPPFPDFKKSEAQTVINKIVKRIDENVDKISRLDKNQWVFIDRSHEDSYIKMVRLWIWKLAKLKKRIEVRFPSQSPILAQVLATLLKSTIEKKATTVPDKTVKNMVLVYDVRTWILPRDLPGNQMEFGLGFDEQVAMAQKALKNPKYGEILFNELWYFIPYKQFDLGHLVRIFPSENICANSLPGANK
jgi:hypothetical protein